MIKIKKKVENLEQEILFHKKKYYSGNALISDEEYDELEEQLQSLKPDSHVLDLVGYPVNNENKLKHQSKMLSLNKVYDLENLKKWLEEHDCIVMYKIDGSSASLVYKDGVLKIAKTRGDGEYGENILEKALFISNIPKKIKEKNEIEIRGEIYCKKLNFQKIISKFEEKNLKAPSSLRNVVAGILSRKEHVELAGYLSFSAFELIDEKSNCETEIEKLKKLNDNNFLTPDFEIVDAKKNLDEIIEKGNERIKNESYLIDGLVFIFNDLSIHDELGETSHHPRYKMAYKYKGETAVSKIHNILWQVSRNGILTPVANIEPVSLSGAEISRVTLHNFGNVKENNIKNGDEIEITRSGDVIPKYLKTVRESQNKLSYPVKCPSCKIDLQKEEIRLRCTNKNCEEKVKNEIKYFVKSMGIEGLSDKRIEILCQNEIIKSSSDIYEMKKENIVGLDKIQDKLANKILESIEKSKKVHLVKLVKAVGIQGASTTKIQKIIKSGHNTIEKLLALEVNDLKEIEGFAEKSSEVIVESLKSKKNILESLIKKHIEVIEEDLKEEGFLNNKKICVTGKTENKRSVIEKLISRYGGTPVKSITKDTNYLVTNDADSKSSKMVKASKFGIKIITEKYFLEWFAIEKIKE